MDSRSLSDELSRASSPLSVQSRSPTPPGDYPSPMRTDEESPAPTTPSKPPKSHSRQQDRDGPPPAKRRKLEPKVRTTERLDLTSSGQGQTEDLSGSDLQLERLLKALRTKRKIVVIAGAGISVSAGSMFPPHCKAAPPILTAIFSS